MGFVFQPYLSRGSSTPCVARTMIQTADLVGAFPLDEPKRKELIGISHDVMLKLVACLDSAEPIIQQTVEGRDKVTRGDMPVGAGGQAIQLPAVVDLRARAETFLYNVKLALREIARLFRPLHGQEFNHKYQKIRQWTEAAYGTEDPLGKMLAADATWIERMIGMRNAVDHPGTGDGVLTVENFRLVETGSSPTVAEPCWYRAPEAPVNLADDLESTMDNLLTLYEDILLDGLFRLYPNSPFTFEEIPAEERDLQKPVRFRLGLLSSPQG